MLDELKKNPILNYIIAQEYMKKLELMPISIFEGFNSYIKKIFKTVVNYECDSVEMSAETTGNFKYDYRYEFKDIESLRFFLEMYFNYCKESKKFRSILITDDDINLEIAAVYSILLGKLDFADISDEGIKSNEEILGCNIHKIYEKIKGYLNETDRITSDLDKECMFIIDLQEKFQDNFCFTYGNGDMLRLWNYLGYIKNLFKDTRNHKQELAFYIIEALFYDFIIGNMNYIDQDDNPVELPISMQISYKNFPMPLNMLSDFWRITELPNDEIVNKIIGELQKTTEQIENDLEYNDKLYNNIDNAVGIYLNELFEKDKNNKSKKKQN